MNNGNIKKLLFYLKNTCKRVSFPGQHAEVLKSDCLLLLLMIIKVLGAIPLSVMWQPVREGSLRENGYSMCMAESLCCPPETITTLLLAVFQYKIKSFFVLFCFLRKDPQKETLPGRVS